MMQNGLRLGFGVLVALQTGLLAGQTVVGGQTADIPQIGNSRFDISWTGTEVSSWRYTIRPKGESVDIEFPVFEIDGKPIPAVLGSLSTCGVPVHLRNGATEYVYEGPFANDDTIHMQVKFRIAADDPVVRFCYGLRASGGQTFTKKTGGDNLIYLSYSMVGYPQRKEVRLSVFNEMIHSCNLSEVPIASIEFANSASVVGPIFLGSNARTTLLCAYEHDSMYPDRFLEYRLQPDESVALRAVRGNYYEGQAVDAYSTVWFEIAGADGGEDRLAEEYRTFVLRHLSENIASRKPYIYYNTWGRQERVKWAGGQYLTSMNLEYTLREIERAHEMGVDIYVLDAGWFEKTGDWNPNPKSFPDGFSQVMEKIRGFGMQLGVWMDPAKVAVSSRALEQNAHCVRTQDGKAGAPSPEWETEDSVNMCLVSPYWDYYAGTIIRLYKELGIHYFYLDGVTQSGCDDPGHFHGVTGSSLKERQDCYGFLLPVYLGKIVEKVGAECPDVIFDFDVTELRRIGLGLQFLASGRYFILNNGPYFHNFDLCPRGESILPNGCRSIFIQPGPARTWFMRSVLDYDRWIPSNLVMANYQPDDPANSQIMNLASLMLGQNAIWGEILKTSPEGVALFDDVLGRYRQVRDDVTAASPVRVGRPGDTPEIYEKINSQTGKGIVAIFANSSGVFSYVTRHIVANPIWHNDGVTVEMGGDGHATISAEFREASARIVFFGAK